MVSVEHSSVGPCFQRMWIAQLERLLQLSVLRSRSALSFAELNALGGCRNFNCVFCELSIRGVVLVRVTAEFSPL